MELRPPRSGSQPPIHRVVGSRSVAVAVQVLPPPASWPVVIIVIVIIIIIIVVAYRPTSAARLQCPADGPRPRQVGQEHDPEDRRNNHDQHRHADDAERRPHDPGAVSLLDRRGRRGAGRRRPARLRPLVGRLRNVGWLIEVAARIGPQRSGFLRLRRLLYLRRTTVRWGERLRLRGERLRRLRWLRRDEPASTRRTEGLRRQGAWRGESTRVRRLGRGVPFANAVDDPHLAKRTGVGRECPSADLLSAILAHPHTLGATRHIRSPTTRWYGGELSHHRRNHQSAKNNGNNAQQPDSDPRHRTAPWTAELDCNRPRTFRQRSESPCYHPTDIGGSGTFGVGGYYHFTTPF